MVSSQLSSVSWLSSVVKEIVQRLVALHKREKKSSWRTVVGAERTLWSTIKLQRSRNPFGTEFACNQIKMAKHVQWSVERGRRAACASLSDGAERSWKWRQIEDDEQTGATEFRDPPCICMAASVVVHARRRWKTVWEDVVAVVFQVWLIWWEKNLSRAGIIKTWLWIYAWAFALRMELGRKET
jgi:hypothetical protein